MTVRVYPVPETLLWRLMPNAEPEPQVPMHVMATKTGPQERTAKIGDPEWEPYRQAHDRWQRKHDELENDARIVLSQRESADQPNYNWPDELEPPAHLRLLVEDGELEWPKSRTRQRAMWFRSVIAPSAEDVSLIIDAAMILSGMEEEAVKSLRQRFRSDLRDRLFREMAVPEDEVQPVVEEGEGGDEGGQD
jgi:hypothetical protein